MTGSTSARARSPSPGAGRSFLAKFKSPFGSKARNVSEFYVQPDDLHRQYAPGDLVSGSVVLKIIRPVRITHLVVCLHGYVQVYKTPNNPGDGYRTYSAALAQGKTRKGGGYYGSGFASLFEDEVVLCGDGRLGEGTYQFNFELQLPREKLPSSIDFERGVISYMITATLTRPTTIGPTMSCERQIDFQERIDVANLYKPKPRVISLEPISRRRRAKQKPNPISTPTEGQSQLEPDRLSGESAERSTVDGVSIADTDPPQSPSPSHASLESGNSSRGTASVLDSNSVSGRTGDSKMGRAKHPHSHLHTVLKPITAKIELEKAGFLRGDSIPVRIAVNHTKPVKSLHGVIVTFYRQARVDYQPSLTKVGSSKSSDTEIYPRSKTGLSGLSITSSHSSHLFRKDLSQSFASLIINPSTLTAEVKATVRVPDGAFPSISNVPGAMISFKYYVEVVLDLQNKLAGLDRFLPNAGMSGVSTHADTGVGIGGSSSQSVFAPWGGHFIDTEEIRRDKAVVSCIFEVVIGTTDSERKGKWRAMAGPMGPYQSEPTQTEDANQDPQTPHPYPLDQTPQYAESNGVYSDAPLRSYSEVPSLSESPPPPIHAIPVPDFAAEEQHLSEKERMRRAEERLLPSRPPIDSPETPPGPSQSPSGPHIDSDGPSAASRSIPPLMNGGPSAPPASDTVDDQPRTNLQAPNGDYDDISSRAPAYQENAGPSRFPAAESAEPSSSQATAPGFDPANITDDKQELQRRRLELERSAPPLDAEASEPTPPSFAPSAPPVPSAPSAPETHEVEASAPTLEELSLGFSTGEPLHNEHPLPRYER